MKWNKRFEYPKSVRSSVDGKRTYEVGDEKLPSVTTILSQTQSDEKRESLAKWIAKKGKNEAERVKNEAAKRGSAMHSILERHILGNNVLDLTDVGQEAHRMAKVVIDKGFPNLEEVYTDDSIYGDKMIINTKATSEPSKRISYTKAKILSSKHLFLYFNGKEKLNVFNSAKESNDSSVKPISAFIHQNKKTLNVFCSI